MPRTNKAKSDPKAAAEAPAPAPVAEPKPKAAAKPTRVRALANIKRIGGHVDAGQEFTPNDDGELKWLLANGHAERA